MRLGLRFGISRFFQALWIGIIAVGLTLSQVSAAVIIPELSTSKPQAQSRVEPSPTGRYFIFFDGQSALQKTKANKGQIQSSLVQNQVAGVRAGQVQQLKTIERLIGRKLPERKHFDLILNAVAVALSLEEAEQIAAQPGVKDVLPVRMRELATDAGPAWVGAPIVWDDPVLTASTTSMGEGVVIGVLDTGINFDHPSFASDPTISGDASGYIYPKQVHYFGVCDDQTSQFYGKCNDKLIGAYSMTGENLIEGNNSPEDPHGHGSHTASTAAGNRDVEVTYSRMIIKISGMAPHAQLIAFDVCIGSTCYDDAIIDALQQALHDDVDVINYSISSMIGPDGYPVGPYDDPIEMAFLEMFQANTFVSAAAANADSGPPTQGLVNHLAPWVSTVAATTHNRRFQPGPVLNPIWGDIRASFSMQGPAAAGMEVLKPDLAAPGLSILAANKDGTNDEDNSKDVYIASGTSMSTPFVAGAAALLISAHPDWTPAEVKSALMLTTKTDGVYKNDAHDEADPFDIGSGRIQVNFAVNSGLIMDETAANMAAADPAMGGDPKTLNLPTMQNNFCQEACSWNRTVRNATATEESYTVKSPSWIIVEPSQFTIAPGAWKNLKITALTIGKPMQAWDFAQIDLIPRLDPLRPLHLTAAVFTVPLIRYYFPFLVK